MQKNAMFLWRFSALVLLASFAARCLLNRKGYAFRAIKQIKIFHQPTGPLCDLPLHPPSYTSVFRAFYGSKEELQTCIFHSFNAFWPSSAVWPEGGNLAVIWDGESEKDRAAAEETREKEMEWPLVHHLFEELPSRGAFQESAFRRGWGYDRQQYSNMIVDLVLERANLTSEYVGIGDTDSPLVAPILPDALFHFDDFRKMWLPRVIGYNGCCTGWHKGNKFALGENSSLIGEFMVVIGFPIIVKSAHLKDVRKTMVKKILGEDLHNDVIVGGQFEEAFARLTSSGVLYSQFDLIMHVLWEQHRDEYYWIIRDQKRVRHPGFGLESRLSESPDVLAMDRHDQIPHLGVMKHACKTWEPFYRDFVCLASDWSSTNGCLEEERWKNESLLEELFVDWEISKMGNKRELPKKGWFQIGTQYLNRARHCNDAKFAWMRPKQKP